MKEVRQIMARHSATPLRINKGAIEALMEATQELGIEVLGIAQDMAVMEKHISPTGQQVKYAGQLALSGGRRTCPDETWMKTLARSRNKKDTNQIKVKRAPVPMPKIVTALSEKAEEETSTDSSDSEAEEQMKSEDAAEPEQPPKEKKTPSKGEDDK